MANLFDEQSVILEGFLCPICHRDLKTPDRLTHHVEKDHAEEQDPLQALKEIFTKQSLASFAKKRLNRDSQLSRLLDSGGPASHQSGGSAGGAEGGYQFYYVQEVGVDCDHTAQFKEVRSYRIDRYATETNKLIIRLSKLLTNRPDDALKRKHHEQQLIPWVDGKLVQLCPNCAEKFNLIRRQHHCRLCGSVMCQKCSCYLNTEAATCLINPIVGEASPLPLAADPESDPKDSTNLRVCEHCLHLLENRKEAQDSRNYRPTIVTLYNQIQELRKEIRPDLGTYVKIIGSLYSGDSVFTLQDAAALRAKIGRVADRIDTMSKQIIGIPAPTGSREETLKKFIRLACIAFIKEEMLALPQIPTEAEIRKIQEERRRETDMRIETERRLAAEALQRLELERNRNNDGQPTPRESPVRNDASSGSAINSVDSWSGFQADTKSKLSSDPLVEQMSIIKSYIKQARQALRFEEVEILEKNLRELQQEFYERQQLNN